MSSKHIRKGYTGSSGTFTLASGNTNIELYFNVLSLKISFYVGPILLIF